MNILLFSWNLLNSLADKVGPFNSKFLKLSCFEDKDSDLSAYSSKSFFTSKSSSEDNCSSNPLNFSIFSPNKVPILKSIYFLKIK